MTHPRHPAFPLPSGWLIQKVLWGVSRSYTGPVLIRGSQVDGQGKMRFYGSGGLQLRFFGRGGDQPSEFRVPGQGCYGWQIDGIGFTTTLVFKAVSAQ